MEIRAAVASDFDAVLRLRQMLWADSSADEVRRMLAGSYLVGGLPAAILLAVLPGGTVAGFVELSVRSYADGCDPVRPVGYLEGWFVDPAWRRQRIGAALVRAAEKWARAHGCAEMASDTWLDNAEAQSAHAALGFEEVDRCVHYRRAIADASST